MKKTLDEIMQNVLIQQCFGELETEIRSIQFDSRKVEPGTVFVATRGTASDGHQFIPMAIEKGAVAIVCEEMPADIKPEITYIKVENSADALGKMASA